MKDSTLAIAALLLIILLGVGAYFLFFYTPTTTPGAVGGVATTTVPAAWQTYNAPGGEFSVQYPPTFDVTHSDGKVTFTIPTAMATGTNLSRNTALSVERGPDRAVCTGVDFLDTVVAEEVVVDKGITYTVARSGDAGAGNIYEEIVYILPDCYAVRYFIHSTQVANYPEGTVQPFDRTALLALFDQIRHTLRMQSKG